MRMPKEHNTTLYGNLELECVLDAMSAKLGYKLQGFARVLLVGVRRRGAPLADKLYERLCKRFPESTIERIDLSIKRYADDLTLLFPQTQLTEQPEHVGIDLSGCVVVLVDDVLYGGFSLNKAVQYLLGKGVRTIMTAVLVDRVSTKLPIRADIVGLKLQVAEGNVVECHIPPFESMFQIVLVQPFPR